MKITHNSKWIFPFMFFNAVEAGEFTDDLGRKFNFKKTDKFASRAATGALSLYRMGTDQSSLF